MKKYFLISLISLFLILTLKSTHLFADGNLKAGAAKIDITPPIGTPLCGYGSRIGKPSTGIHDPLYARAVVFDIGSEKIGIIGLDTVILQRKAYDLISKKVEKEAGIKYGNLLISATHTHSGSGGLMKDAGPFLGGGDFNKDVFNKFIDDIASCIITADKKRESASIGILSGTGVGLSNNRTENGGPVDPELGVIKVDNQKGEPIAVLVNFTAHATVLGGENMVFSADYPGYLCRAIETIYPSATAIFINGCEGNQAPETVANTKEYEWCERLGYSLAGEVLKIMQQIRTEPKLNIKVLNQKLILAKKINFTTYISALVLNDILILTMPGEAFVEIGLNLKKRAKEIGFKNCYIFGLTNDGVGYIPTEVAYHKHQYETLLSLFGPKLALFLEEQLIRLAEKIRREAVWLDKTGVRK